nr:MAG TPA: hypothetical protein [Caudoviricetes sp.]
MACYVFATREYCSPKEAGRCILPHSRQLDRTL